MFPLYQTYLILSLKSLVFFTSFVNQKANLAPVWNKQTQLKLKLDCLVTKPSFFGVQGSDALRQRGPRKYQRTRQKTLLKE